MSETKLPAYDPASVESRWRERIRVADGGRPAPPTGRSLYLLTMFPSPAGQLHVRQMRLYTLADTLARYRRACGDDVLYPIGFDSFTTFVEAAAIQTGIAPRKLATLSQKRLRAQLDRMAFSFDWSRSFSTADDQIYRWSQWLFLKLLERGLVYRASAPVAWCEKCDTPLAASLVEGGCCPRCGDAIREISRQQWFLRMTGYLDDLYAGTDRLTSWGAEQSRQRSLLGRTEGVEIDLIASDGQSLTAFTPYPDAVGGAAFVAIAPDHPITSELGAADGTNPEDLGAPRAERRVGQLPVVPTGTYATLPGLSLRLPIVVSATVSHRFGAGAVLGIPAVDTTDAAIAQKLGIEAPNACGPSPEMVLRPAVRYRIRDFVISRTRSWGVPIPIVHCAACGVVPVPESELPVVLPPDLTPSDKGQPLANHPSFSHCACPKCGAPARREADTLDCHTDALWCWMIACVPPAERREGFFEHPELRRWLPVEQVLWTEGRSECLLDIRFATRFLQDLGLLKHVPQGEPFRNILVTGNFRIGESKVGNGFTEIANPDKLVQQFGADCVRLSLLHAASPRKDFTWTGASLVECRRFLRELWKFVLTRVPKPGPSEPVDRGDARSERDCNRLRLWRTTALARINANLADLDFHSAVRNVMLLFERIRQFERMASQRHGYPNEPSSAALRHAVFILLRTLAPMTPHVAEELWERCGGTSMLATMPWPSADEPPAADTVVTSQVG